MQNQEERAKNMILDPDAILFYAEEPVYFVEDIIRANPDQHQRDILRSVRDNPMTSVRSGHGIGKSTTEAWTIIWWLMTRPFPKIPCTAPTQHQLFDILWSEISKWLRNNPDLKEEIVWTKKKVYLNGHPEEWFAVARTATNPEALQGFHSQHLLFVIDEASGVKDETFEPVLGALSEENARLLMMGNPTKLTGFFFDSHNKNRDQYHAIHVDGRNSQRVSKAFVQKIINMFGEDSDVFRVRVAGQFPKSMPDSFIPMELCRAAAERRRPEILHPERIDMGVDVARYGNDSSIIYPVLDLCQSREYIEYGHNNTVELADSVEEQIYFYALEYCGAGYSARITVKIDCDGLGVGVFDILDTKRSDIVQHVEKKRRKKFGAAYRSMEIPAFELDILECHFGTEGGKVSEDDPIEYFNSTGLMWGTVRNALKNGKLQIPDDEALIKQLSNRRYRVEDNGTIRLERKEEMKKRGVSSPDIADALALAMYAPEELMILPGDNDLEKSSYWNS